MSEQELVIIQKLLLVLIQVGVPVLATIALSEYKRHLESLRQYNNWIAVKDAVRSAVVAAEQIGLKEDLQEYGGDKLGLAIGFVEAQLAAAGIPIEIDQHVDAIKALIKAEVRRQFPE